MRTFLLLLVVASGLGAGLSGCTECKPLFDVRHCLPGSEACAPQPDGLVVDWNETHAENWAHVDALMRETKAGEHSHEPLGRPAETMWWIYWGIDPESDEKELFARYDGGLYRIRVLSCE